MLTFMCTIHLLPYECECVLPTVASAAADDDGDEEREKNQKVN